MGKKYRSPGNLARSILRLLTYKQAYLEDCWDSEVIIDNEKKKLIWKASETLKLTLKKGIRIIENREYFNPSFVALPFSQKLAIFQSMWELDQDSYNFFGSMHEHLRRKTSKCDHFCGSFSSPYCGRLTYFLSTNTWPFN